MKRWLYIFALLLSSFISMSVVNADLGDTRYEITDIGISGTKITFKGWAFIHRTHNFTEVVDKNGNHVVVENEYGVIDNGDQKILIQAVNKATGSVIESIVSTGGQNNDKNYNFYCQHFYTRSGGSEPQCVDSAYEGVRFPVWEDIGWLNNKNDKNHNKCISQYLDEMCYYEDIGFSVTFDISNWSSFDDGTEVMFKIAISNTDFEQKILHGKYSGARYSYNGDTYTAPEDLFIGKYAAASSSGSIKNSDNISIVENSFSDKVRIIVMEGVVMRAYSNEKYPRECVENGVSVYCTGITDDGYYYDIDEDYYKFGYKESTNNSYTPFLNGGTLDPGKFVIKGKVSDAYIVPCSGDGCQSFSVWGSWIKPSGSLAFTIKINNNKKCEIDAPNLDHLYCNSSGELSSDCDELTVNTGAGSATVKISQKGTISSVLTPDSIYAGGGFNFGIMYYNTITWSYVREPSNVTTRPLVEQQMKDKLKSYSDYIVGLNIAELKIGDKYYDTSFMVKSCKTTDENNDYHDKELTVSCVFYFPKSTLNQDGTVKYSNGVDELGISNKYYTPLNYKGKYKISAKIVGMDRIKEEAARSDSKTKGKPWTGDWSDTFENCEIDIYPLLYTGTGNGLYNFIYRPIDINNPFPDRNAGINWFDWWSNTNNREKLASSYARLQYTAELDNQTIAKIKQYNSNQNKHGGYFDWDTMRNGKSTFVDDYIKREGGN